MSDLRAAAERIRDARRHGYAVSEAHLRALDKAVDALAAPSTPEPSAEDGRPPLPPETVAYDKAFMDGYLAAKRDYSPGGMYAAPSTPEPSGVYVKDEGYWAGYRAAQAERAAPSTPEPSGLREAEQALIRAANAPSLRDPDRLAVPHFRDTEAIWTAIEAALRAAPSTEPALDELRALSDAAAPYWDHDSGSGRLRQPPAVFSGDEGTASPNAAFAVAAVKYVRARLAESQP